MDKDQNQFGVFRENRNQLDALMFIKVFFHCQNTKNHSQKLEFPALYEPLYSHNHLLDSLFELGHIEVTARQMLQMELELQSDEDYEEAYMDSSKLP
ncbi:hypothetical protein HNY73_011313 [Argiope bruennichi]|uniref:Uncharacterized protein n=1 Tax=Argiope bruennichi TaxID=94029 RepID=A0A8T0F670_ARGBR|nr:hypothetical protein HNY73_011313 [Argiope bruennichi]